MEGGNRAAGPEKCEFKFQYRRLPLPDNPIANHQSVFSRSQDSFTPVIFNGFGTIDGGLWRLGWRSHWV